MCGTSQIFCSNIFSCCRISNFHNEKRWKIKCSTCLSLWRGCEIVFWKDAKLKISQRAYSYSTEGRYQDRWSSWQGGGICSGDRADCTLRCPEKEVQKSHKTFYRALHAGVHILYWSPVSTIANRCYELREPALSARQAVAGLYIKFFYFRVVSDSVKS